MQSKTQLLICTAIVVGVVGLSVPLRSLAQENPKSRIQWEYLIEKDKGGIVNQLNSLGSQGWAFSCPWELPAPCKDQRW